MRRLLSILWRHEPGCAVFDRETGYMQHVMEELRRHSASYSTASFGPPPYRTVGEGRKGAEEQCDAHATLLPARRPRRMRYRRF